MKILCLCESSTARAIWAHARLSSPNCSNYFAYSPTLSFSFGIVLNFYLSVYEAARYIWAPTFQLSSSRCNRHLPIRSTIALKTCICFSNYYCRAFERFSTMLASLCSWYGALMYCVWVLCSVLFEIFLQHENTYWHLWLKYLLQEQPLAWYFFWLPCWLVLQ